MLRYKKPVKITERKHLAAVIFRCMRAFCFSVKKRRRKTHTQTVSWSQCQNRSHTLKCGSRAFADNIIAPLIWHIVIIIFHLDLCACTSNENRFFRPMCHVKHWNKNKPNTVRTWTWTTDDCNDYLSAFVSFQRLLFYLNRAHIPAMLPTFEMGNVRENAYCLAQASAQDLFLKKFSFASEQQQQKNGCHHCTERRASIWKHSLSEFRAVLWFDDVQNSTNMVKVIVSVSR